MTTSRGRKMNIDLDSWEAGYADGQRGRPPQSRLISIKCRIRAISARVARGERSRARRGARNLWKFCKWPKSVGCCRACRNPQEELYTNSEDREVRLNFRNTHSLRFRFQMSLSV